MFRLGWGVIDEAVTGANVEGQGLSEKTAKTIFNAQRKAKGRFSCGPVKDFNVRFACIVQIMKNTKIDRESHMGIGQEIPPRVGVNAVFQMRQ